MSISASIGDIDGDGKPDLAVISNDSNSLSVLRNTSNPGTVSFAAKVDFSTGTNPSSISMGDIDGDGKPDLAVANSNGTSVSTFKNTSNSGTVSFSTSVNFSSTGNPNYENIGDLDGDGKSDLVVSNPFANSLTIFLQKAIISTSSYNALTGVLEITGSGFIAKAGTLNDIASNKLTLTGEGGTTYTLTSANVEISSATSFSITLNATDLAAVNLMLNKNGTSSTGGTTFNLAAAADWMAAASGSADLTGNGITVSNVTVPAITSATYDSSTGALVITGTGFLKSAGATNDIDATKLTLTGQAGGTYTLTASTANVEITSGTAFTLTLGSTDKTAVNALLNQNGTSSLGATNYNLAAAEDWNSGADAAVVIADLTGNGITVSNIPPVITSFSPSSGPVGTLVTITGTNLGTPTAFTIGSKAAIVISNTGTSLVGMVMPGAATGTISVTTTGGSVTSVGTFTLSTAPAPNAQQGTKLVGTGNTGASGQGYAVSLSADGNTAIVGGFTDNSNQGAAWIYTRSGATWSQQGAKLVGTGNVGAGGQGIAVSLSADGNTAIVGGHLDNSNRGAVWVYTRSGTTWTQQGTKLVGTGNTGSAQQGFAVSLSADGNTAISGGRIDDNFQGAAWIFTRSGTTWSQQGNKLVGTGYIGASGQGTAVSLSADGNTAMVGGYNDNSNEGAVWVYTRSGITWSQQGSKLVGIGNTGPARQGRSVSLSADGNTAMIGGLNDNSNQGAAWVFTRSGTTWTQQGTKLVGTGNNGAALQGQSVYLSADGNTAMVGGINDNSNLGSTWVFTRIGTTWSQQGSKLVGTGNNGVTQQGWAVSLSADGTTAMVGGNQDNSNVGAAWAYTYVPPPTITSFTPTSTATGATITLTGTNFTGATVVSFGGTAATSFNVVSATSITAVIAAGTSGDVSVTAPGGTGTRAGFTFIPAPVITSFTPTSAGSTTTVTLTGTDFTGTTAVSFGGTAATSFNVVSATSITAVVAAGTSGNVSVTTPGGTGILAGFTFIPAPTITSFTPTSAGSTTTVTLTGTDFTGATAVSFGGTAATSFNVVSATSITAVVAAGTSGNVSVTTPGGTGTLAGFIFIPAPIITSFTPTSAATGSTVTLTGTNFTGTTAVSFGGTAATSFNVVSATSITAVVAAGTSGNVSVTTPGGTVVLAGFTFIPAPVITSFTPTSAATGATVTLTGTNFIGATALSFGGTAATSFNVVSATSITAVVATGTSGNISVTTPGGTGVLAGFTFIPAPVITSFTPISAATGATVTLTGTNFTGATAVSFGGTAANSFNVVSATSITAVVAAGTSGNVSVTTPGGTGLLAGFTLLSTDASLSAMALSSGTLSPVFASATTNYTTTVPFTTSSITLSPTRSEGTATIKVNGNTVSSGTASAGITLAVGTNVISTIVTAGDGTTTKTYQVSVTRQAQALSTDAGLSAMALSSATLSPVFVSATTAYTATVPFTTSSITLSPTRSEGTATIKVNGNTVSSGTASAAITLAVGPNTISTVVTAGDGTTTKTYQVSVTRQAQALSTEAGLSAMALSSGTLSPVFASATTSYTATVPFTTSSITLSPTQSEGTATIKVNGNTVSSGTASAGITLAVGPNVISTVVTAGDGTTTKTYQVSVTRQAQALSTEAGLSALAISSGTLSPVFASATTSYTATVPFTTSSITLSPTQSEGTATIKVNGNTVSSGTASAGITLAVGPNTITTIVTAGDGTTTKTYQVSVTRTAASTIANLLTLTLSNGTLSPAFAPATLNYVAHVNNNISSITLVPGSEHPGATIKVNGITVPSQSASGNIPLAVGNNTITVIATAENGTSSKTYTLTVTRVNTDQILANENGNTIVTNTAREIVVISPTIPITITIPIGIINSSTVVYSNLISGGKGTIPQTIISTPFARIEIPASSNVNASGNSWNGNFLAPAITNYNLPAKPGIVIKTGVIVEIGSPDFSLSFDKALRIVLYGQAGMRVARVHSNRYEEILLTGADNQAAGDALAPDASFKLNSGNDLVIWTKGLSKFITFSETADLDVALVIGDKTELTDDLIKGTNKDLSSVTTAISLPSTGPNGSAITWESSDPAVLSNDGKTIARPLFGSGDVTVTLKATLTKGAITDTKIITIVILQLPNQAPALSAIANQVVCYTTVPQTIALSGITPGPESTQTTLLSVSSSNSSLFANLSVVPGIGGTAQLRYTPGNSAGGTATVTVTVKDNGGTANGGIDSYSRTFTVTVNPLPVINISSDLGTEISKGLTAQLTANGGSSYSWTNAQGIVSGQNSPVLRVRPAVTTTYTVTVTNASGCSTTHNFTIRVNDDYQALTINNVLSPNGDGRNDLLVIKNLDMYPTNTLKVFNKSGRAIYTKVNYTNDWDGTFNGSALVEDTYYYILDFGPGLHKLKGYVSIVR